MNVTIGIRNGEIKIKDLVKDKKAFFTSYCGGLLNYKTEDGFEFSIPTSDTGSGQFETEMKAITLMRWINKQFELIKKEI